MAFYQNRYVQLGIAFGLGGVVTALFMQETIVKRYREGIVEQSRRFEASIEQQKRTYESQIKELRQHQTQDTFIVTKPDGTVTEHTVIVTDTQTIDRIRKEAEETTKTQIAEIEAKYQKQIESLTVERNRKRLDLFGGALSKDTWVAGGNYPIWGPFTLGLVMHNGSKYPLPTIGVRF